MVGSPRQWPKWHRPRTSLRPQRERERKRDSHVTSYKGSIFYRERERESCHIIQGKHLLDQSMLQGCVKGHHKVPVNNNFFKIFLTIFLFYLQLYKYRLVFFFFFFFLFCNLTSTSRLLTFTIFLTCKSSKTLQLLNDNKPSQLKGQCFSCISILTIMSHV